MGVGKQFLSVAEIKAAAKAKATALARAKAQAKAEAAGNAKAKQAFNVAWDMPQVYPAQATDEVSAGSPQPFEN